MNVQVNPMSREQRLATQRAEEQRLLDALYPTMKRDKAREKKVSIMGTSTKSKMTSDAGRKDMEERRAFDASLASVDKAQNSSPAAIAATRAEDESRLFNYDAMAAWKRGERLSKDMYKAARTNDERAYAMYSQSMDRHSKLQARGLSQ